MYAQRLRLRVTIQRKDSTVDPYGQAAITWTNVGSVWADIIPVTGKEMFSADANQNQLVAKIVIRARGGIDPTMRVVHGTTFYSIEAVLPVSEREIQLLCSAGLKDD
jgi:SPP1 family predicted phage head-tail adaptor